MLQYIIIYLSFLCIFRMVCNILVLLFNVINNGYKYIIFFDNIFTMKNIEDNELIHLLI